MATSSVTVLCPNAHRIIVKTTPNTSILQILEEACVKYKYNPDKYTLKHMRRVLDVTTIFRFAGLPNRCVLEMTELSKPRMTQAVTICVKDEHGNKYVHDYQPTVSLWNVLDRSVGSTVLQDCSRVPVAVYSMRRIAGKEQLFNTTLKSLGLNSGTGALRFSLERLEGVAPPAPMPEVIPVQLPEIIPIEIDRPEVVPINVDRPEVVPINVDRPEIIPINVDIPEIIPINLDGPEIIPINPDRPEIIPINVDRPELVPIKVDRPEIIPNYLDRPEIITINVDGPEIIPINVDRPEIIDVNIDVSEVVPLNVDIPEVFPISVDRREIVPTAVDAVVMPEVVALASVAPDESSGGGSSSSVLSPDVVSSSQSAGVVPDVLTRQDDTALPPDVLCCTEPSSSSGPVFPGAGRSLSTAPACSAPDAPSQFMEVDSTQETASVALSSRDCVVFRGSEANDSQLQQQQQRQDEGDDFFTHTIDDVKRLVKEQQKRLQELTDAPLQTKGLREADQQARMLATLNKFPVTQLRIYFPGDVIVQTSFRPSDTVQDVAVFVTGLLRSDTLEFELVSLHPRRPLPRDSSLLAAGLVPKARLLFSSSAAADVQLLQPAVIRAITTYSAAQRALVTARASNSNVGLGSAPCLASSPALSTHTSATKPVYSSDAKKPKWFKVGK